MTVYNYISSADWHYRLEPTDTEGEYYLITTHHQVAEACKWLDENLKEMFTKYIP